MPLFSLGTATSLLIGALKSLALVVPSRHFRPNNELLPRRLGLHTNLVKDSLFPQIIFHLGFLSGDWFSVENYPYDKGNPRTDR